MRRPNSPLDPHLPRKTASTTTAWVVSQFEILSWFGGHLPSLGPSARPKALLSRSSQPPLR
jgi:hypothetical protein